MLHQSPLLLPSAFTRSFPACLLCLYNALMHLGDHFGWLLIEDFAKTKEGIECRTFDTAFEKTNVSSIQAHSKCKLFLSETGGFPELPQVLSKDRIWPGRCFHANHLPTNIFQIL
jgi:hypothetical protein